MSMYDEFPTGMNPGVEIAIMWWDQDVIRYRITCSNGRFSGQTEVYENHDGLSRMADALNGFPSTRADLRNFEIGTFDPNHALGGVHMLFFCVDSVGHIAVNVKLRGEGSLGWAKLNQSLYKFLWKRQP